MYDYAKYEKCNLFCVDVDHKRNLENYSVQQLILDYEENIDHMIKNCNMCQQQNLNFEMLDSTELFTHFV
ncbi:hypothetical protein LA02_1234 [Francisella philomiragia]|nr:hypothetical protein LA02_1234 [Francisella philomiragia]